MLKSAVFYLNQGDLYKSMQALLVAEAFTKLEEFLGKWGMELVFMNRQLTLAALLQKIPAERIRASAWFSFFSGLVLQQTDPSKSKVFFLRSRELFKKKNHILGELLTLGELVYFFIVLSPDQNQCTEYLTSGNHLFEKCGAELPSFCRANTAKNLGTGCFYFLNDFHKAKDYCRTAEAAALESGSASQLVETLSYRGLVHLYLGEFADAENIAGRIQILLNTSSCGLRGRLAGYYLQLQVLHLKGNYQAYQRLKKTLLKKIDIQTLGRTIIYAYIILYDISIATAGGKLDKIQQLIDNHLENNHFKAVQYLRNEMLAIKVLSLAERGCFIPEGHNIAEALLPETSADKTPGYKMKLLLPLAIAYGLTGDMQKAHKLINQELDLARQVKTYPFIIYGRMVRALITILEGDLEEARHDLEYGLTAMYKLQTRHCYYLSPIHMQLLLNAAVKMNIRVDFVQLLAAETQDVAFLGDGSSIPLLHIQTLGIFSLTIRGQEVARANDFTTTQRHLLGLIISSPRFQISLENIQLMLWPDSAPAKARNRMDALLSRLRKTLAKLFSGYPVNNYLILERGIVSLRNCRIDAQSFINFVKEGLTLIRGQQWWQAGNILNGAMELWQGSFATDLLASEQAYDYDDKLLDSLTDLGLAWCPQMAGNGLLGKAIRVAKQIQEVNTTDERLVGMLYGLYMQNKEPLRARKLYSNFAYFLQHEEYPHEEIEQILARIETSCYSQVLPQQGKLH